MLCFFHMTRDINVTVGQSGGFVYSHPFKGHPDRSQIPISSIYVTTPSDYKRICETIKHSGIDDKETCRILSIKEIIEHDQMPKQVSFRESVEEAFKDLAKKDKVTIAVMNAFSHAYGDHLIGMNAFNVFQEELSKKYPNTKFTFNLFQLNPHRMAPITKQWKHLYDNIGTLPMNLSLFYQHDAFMDFGGLLMVKSFDSQPMFDFFLEGFSMKGTSISEDRKRLKYTTMPATDFINSILSKHIRKRSDGRKVIMVHPLSTTPIRTMPNEYAIKTIKELHKQNYFTISAVTMPVKSKNHMNLHNFSTEFDDFAAIVKSSDGIITVDTITVHLSDCFDVPTIAMFTSIEPKYRVSYYPNVKGIMLEDPEGMAYGMHKYDQNSEQGKKIQSHAENLWQKKSPKEVVSELSKMLIHTDA